MFESWPMVYWLTAILGLIAVTAGQVNTFDTYTCQFTVVVDQFAVVVDQFTVVVDQFTVVVGQFHVDD